MPNAQATRTTNPLHFEDLEPHRFEDLVRQLAYGFRDWRRLEGPGRAGSDEGRDVYGVEVVRQASAEPDGDDVVVEERDWVIQCKRQQRIGPTKAREIVSEAVPDRDHPPYGLIVAVASDPRMQSLAAFHAAARERGVHESHLWTKAVIEDLLFRPENDHLLFAYFGISLVTRRRSQLQTVRARITVKNKLIRALGVNENGIEYGLTENDVLIVDVDDDRYPDFRKVPDFAQLRTAPWHMAKVEEISGSVLVARRYFYEGRVKPNGEWDIYEPSVVAAGNGGDDYWQAAGQFGNRRSAFHGQLSIPDAEKRTISEWALIPWDRVVEVDPVGTSHLPVPHVYCRFDGEDGPYRDDAYWFAHRPMSAGEEQLEPELRRNLRIRARESTTGVPRVRRVADGGRDGETA